MDYHMDLWQRLGDMVAASFGKPRALNRMLTINEQLRVHPFEPPRSAAVRNALTHWQRWSEFGYKPNSRVNSVPRWYRDRDEQYRCRQLDVPELYQLTRRTSCTAWQGDIRDIFGISASKSPIEECESLEEFGERYCARYMEEVNDAQLMKCWTHERRFTAQYTGVLTFGQYAWDGRIFWLNQGGSHHFAAAHVLASKLGRRLAVKGELYQYELVPQMAISLLDQYRMFVVPREVYGVLYDELKQLGVTHSCVYAPPPLEGEVLLFERADVRASRVAELLRQFALMDLSARLQDDLTQQFRQRSEGPAPRL